VRLAALASDPDAFSSKLEYEADLEEADWRARLDRAATFGAIFEGAIAGIAVGLTNEKIQHVELVSMWVRPDARGAGVGGRLIEAVVDWARGAGFGEVRLWVVDGNTRAERVYERLGFKRTGIVAPVREGEPLMEFEMSRATAHPLSPL